MVGQECDFVGSVRTEKFVSADFSLCLSFILSDPSICCYTN